MENNPMKRKSVGEAIEDLLSCEICLELLLPPVSQCVNGHVLCNPCFGRLNNGPCPACRVILRTKIENKLMNNVLGCFYKKCKFEGCDERVSLDKIQDHQARCRFNDEIQCPVFCGETLIGGKICIEKFSLRNIEKHLLEAHKVKVEKYVKPLKFKYSEISFESNGRGCALDKRLVMMENVKVLCLLLADVDYCTIRVVPIVKEKKNVVRLSLTCGEHFHTAEKSTAGIETIFNHADFLLSKSTCDLFFMGDFLPCAIEIVPNYK